MGIQQALQDVPPTAKGIADTAVGVVIAASWFDMLKGGLEVLGLFFAVVYAIFRVYEMDTTKRMIRWFRGRF